MVRASLLALALLVPAVVPAEEVVPPPGAAPAAESAESLDARLTALRAQKDKAQRDFFTFGLPQYRQEVLRLEKEIAELEEKLAKLKQ